MHIILFEGANLRKKYLLKIDINCSQNGYENKQANIQGSTSIKVFCELIANSLTIRKNMHHRRRGKIHFQIIL